MSNIQINESNGVMASPNELVDKSKSKNSDYHKQYYQSHKKDIQHLKTHIFQIQNSR